VDDHKCCEVDLSRNQSHIIKSEFFSQFLFMEERKYPSDVRIKKQLSKIHDKEPDQIIIGNGSSDILDILARAFLCDGKIVKFQMPSYAPIKTIIERTGAKVSHCIGSVKFIVNPNNPTGEFCNPQSTNYDYDLVVVDEAYMDYHPERESFVDQIDKRGNVIVVKTFSKFYGLAGMRIGYAIVPKKLVADIEKIQNKYPVSCFSTQAAIHMLNDKDYYRRAMQETKENLSMLAFGLDGLGIERFPSCGNFVSAKIPFVKGFQIRDLNSYPGMEGWKRISCSTKENIKNFLIELEKTL